MEWQVAMIPLVRVLLVVGVDVGGLDFDSVDDADVDVELDEDVVDDAEDEDDEGGSSGLSAS